MDETPKSKCKMIGWIILGITIAFFVAIALRIDDWGRDFTQNTASLDINADRAELRPVELDATREETIDRIRRWVQFQSKWDLVSAGDSIQHKDILSITLKLTRTTPTMRFVDDIEVSVSQNPNGVGVIVNATSRSRIGRADLGQNPRNLIELTHALKP